MCIDPITIPTRSRVLSLVHRQPLLQTVACGRCCECQAQKHSEWYYRIYHEWQNCLDNHGVVFFDTLTYDDDHLPHLSDFMDIEKGSDLDFPCFSRDDLRGFLTRLRENLEYKFNLSGKDYSRFIAAEYGTSENHSHRPHYHCLFFLPSDIDIYEFRQVVHDSWSKGLTDYVREFGLSSNVFRDVSERSRLSVSHYVAKYVQKVSLYQSEIDRRINCVIDKYYHDYADSTVVVRSHTDIDNIEHMFADEIRVFTDDRNEFYKSQTYKKAKRILERVVSQFHLQSQHFGESALRDMDVNDVMDSGLVQMPDCQRFTINIPIPLYFVRKLFYKLENVNGFRTWLPTEDGRVYRAKKLVRLVSRLAARYSCINDTFSLGIDVDFFKLARYVVYYRGRMNGVYSNDVYLDDLVKLPSNYLVYNYCCPSDKELFHESLVSSDFNGCQGQYINASLDNCVPMSQFLKKHAITDSFLSEFNGFDKILDILYDALRKSGKRLQNLFDYVQDFNNRITGALFSEPPVILEAGNSFE